LIIDITSGSITDEGSLGNNIKNLNIPVYKMEMNAGFGKNIKKIEKGSYVRKS